MAGEPLEEAAARAIPQGQTTVLRGDAIDAAAHGARVGAAAVGVDRIDVAPTAEEADLIARAPVDIDLVAAHELVAVAAVLSDEEAGADGAFEGVRHADILAGGVEDFVCAWRQKPRVAFIVNR